MFKYMRLCIPVFLQILPLLTLISILESASHREEKPILFRHIIIPQFPSPHLKHAVKPLTFIIRMTCFSRLRQAVLAIISEGRSLPRHKDCLTGPHTSVFVVWPIEPFVSGGECLILNAATSAAEIGDRWSHKSEFTSTFASAENHYQDFPSVTVRSFGYKLGS